MSWSIILRGLAFRLPAAAALALTAALVSVPLPAPPAWAGDDGEWTVEILAQSDSRAELRPCT